MAAEATGILLVPVEVGSPDTLEAAFKTLGTERVERCSCHLTQPFTQGAGKLPSWPQQHIYRRFMVIASTSKMADS